jgi:hypothetical protein
VYIAPPQILRSCLWILQYLQTRNRNLVSLQRLFMACGFRKRRCGMKFCNAYSLKFSMDSEGRICLLYDFVLRYIFHRSFYDVITNLWLPFSSLFCSSVVLVSVFLFCHIGHDFITCYSMLLLAYVLRNQLQVSIFWSTQENLHRATMYVIDHLSNEMQQGVETLCEYRGGGLFFLCFFCCCREARRSRSFETFWSRRDDVAMH